jgi:hypothetical protein
MQVPLTSQLVMLNKSGAPNDEDYKGTKTGDMNTELDPVGTKTVNWVLSSDKGTHC